MRKRRITTGILTAALAMGLVGSGAQGLTLHAQAAGTQLQQEIEALSADEQKEQTGKLIDQLEDQDLSAYSDEAKKALKKAKKAAQAALDRGEEDMTSYLWLLKAASQSMITATDEETLYAGIWELEARLCNPFEIDTSIETDEDSAPTLQMTDSTLNGLLTVPIRAEVYEEDGETAADLLLTFYTEADADGQDIDTFIASVSYYPEWTALTAPENTEEKEADIEESITIADEEYLQTVRIPVDPGARGIWLCIETDDGEETYVILELNWEERTQIEGLDTDKSSLKKLIKKANNVTAEDAADADAAAFDAVLDYAKATKDNLNAPQTGIDAVTETLTAAIALVGGEDSEEETDETAGTEESDEADDDIEKAAEFFEEVISPLAAQPFSIITLAAEETVIETESTLDYTNLEDGIYCVYGEIFKTDKATYSMSNDAINHYIMITVADGEYTITMDFMGMEISSKLGYLKDLAYYATGYTTNVYGVPQGTVIDVTIDSYQEYTDGGRVSDDYDTDYPDIIHFPMIPEALEDGYVPMKVYVPIMEAIAEGNGTQSAYLYLDWSTLYATTVDDANFTNVNNNGTSGEAASSSSDSDAWETGSYNLLNDALPSLDDMDTDSLSTDALSSLTSSTLTTGDALPVLWMVIAVGAGIGILWIIEYKKGFANMRRPRG